MRLWTWPAPPPPAITIARLRGRTDYHGKTDVAVVLPTGAADHPGHGTLDRVARLEVGAGPRRAARGPAEHPDAVEAAVEQGVLDRPRARGADGEGEKENGAHAPLYRDTHPAVWSVGAAGSCARATHPRGGSPANAVSMSRTTPRMQRAPPASSTTWRRPR